MSVRSGITSAILLSCLVSLPGIARGVQVEAFVITDAPPSCLFTAGSPRAVTIYRLTDPQVFAWFRLTDVLAGDAPRIEWVDPAGQVRRNEPWRQVPENGTYCYTSTAFKIAEAVPPLTPGTWSVKLYLSATLLATRTFTILRPCGCTVSQASFSFEKAAGTGSVAVAADPACQWTATTSSSWIFLTSGMAGVGNGTVRFSVGTNTGNARAGTIVILDQTVTVTQSGIATSAPQVVHSRMVRSKPAACDFENPPANVTTFLTTDVEAYHWMAIDNVSVGDVLARDAFTPAGTKYAAWSNAWLPSTISGGACFTSSALKIAGAEPASMPGAWVAKMTMNGYPLLNVTFEIKSPVVDPVCTASLTPGSQSAPAEGGNFNVSVGTGTACSWTAASNADWISIQSGSSGFGMGTVAYRVAANTAPTPRTGTLTIAGQSFTVTQSGATTCTYAIDPASVAMPDSGGTGSVSVKTASQCRWTAVSNSNWLSVTGGASGTGNGSVNFSAAANTGAAARTGTLTIGGQTFTVQQAGPTVFAQAMLSTVAGADWIFPRGDLVALDAPLGQLEGVAAGASGKAYVADYGNCMVFQVTPDGVLSAVAGNGICAYSGDGGLATSASISYPSDVQVDGDGNLYVADFGNHRIRKVTPDGIISTIAGTGSSATSGDGGPARQAAIRAPRRLAWDAAGNLYVTTDQRVRRISREGVITTVAGNGETKFAGDGGYATDASFSLAEGIAVDAAGNIYVADWNDNRIRRITTDGIINTFAGDGQPRFAGDGGPALSASLKSPAGLAFDLSGNLIVADVSNRRVRKIDLDGTISTVAGDGNLGFTGDGGPATSAALTWPYAVAVDTAGNLLVADTQNWRLRRVSPEGIIQTLAGNGRYRAVDDGASALNVYMNLPTGFTRDAQGNAYVADTLGHRVWKVSPNGTIAAFAGRGLFACCADGGPAVAASMSSPADVAIDARGEVYIADSIDDRIRKVDAAGKISTFGGTGLAGFGGDGGAVSKAEFNAPSGLAFDAAGNLYVADTNNHRVRKVAPDGTITTVAGTGESGYSGDGGPGTSAKLYYPERVAVDRGGNVYIADYLNSRIRKLTPAGIITTVAGNGQLGFSGDGGPATQTKLFFPQGVAVDQAGNIYIADSWGNRVRMVTPNGLITTIAGNGRAGFSGDGGPALDGSLNRPVDLEVSGDTLYILDHLNNRLRVLQTRIITLESVPGTLSFTGQAGGGQVQAQAVWVSGSSPGLQYAAAATTESGGAWLGVSPASGSLPGFLQVIVNPSRVSVAGTYRGTVRVTAAGGALRTIGVTFQVQESNPPKMEFEPKEFRLSISEEGQAEDVLWVLNRGGGQLSFSANAGASGWLKVSSSAPRATAAEPGVVNLGIDGRSLAPGTYTGTVTVSTASGEQIQVPVTLAVVGTRKPKLLVSHKAVAFLARAGGGDAPHDVSIVNIGQGVMGWSAEAQSDRGWLSLAISGGTTNADSATVPVMRVSADPGALGPGEYTGQITIRAPEADDGVQRINATLTIVRDESQLAPIVRPTGMVFRAASPSAAPGSQDISIFNITSRRVNYDAGLIPQPAVSWFQFTPASGGVPEFTSRQQNMVFLKVQPMLEGSQGAGLREATLTVKLGSVNRNINLYLFQPGASAGPNAAGARSAEGACAATTLYPIFTTLESEFQATLGRAVSIVVSVVDDCGDPVTAGSVLAAFSNGDPGIPLVSLKDGRWAGSWLPRSSARRVGITVRAWRSGDNRRGEAVLTGNLSAP